MRRNYAGWSIFDNGEDYHPTTGRFYALRWGVRMGANTEEGLIHMIDLREHLERERKRKTGSVWGFEA